MSRAVWAAGAAGALFGMGLALSGMTDARRVLGFLDITGDFDPTLLWVLGSALLVSAIGQRWVLRRQQPLYADRFRLPVTRRVDARLLLGAALFGIGWGWAGYCQARPSPGWPWRRAKPCGSCLRCLQDSGCTTASSVEAFTPVSPCLGSYLRITGKRSATTWHG